MRTTPETRALTNLVESANAGHYSLPADVTDAWDVYQRVRHIQITEPEALDLEAAAEQIVAAVADPSSTGQADPLVLAQTVAQGRADVETATRARHLLNRAVEKAGTEAALVADDMSETIITEHLRPALMELYDEARAVAVALDGHSLTETHALAVAPTKVRTAYASLPGLAARRSVIFTARRQANTLGGQQSMRDQAGMFAELENLGVFYPGLAPTAQMPATIGPTDSLERLLWLVSDEVAPARPWLPTAAEQDSAWMRQFGEQMEMRASRARDAVAIASMIG